MAEIIIAADEAWAVLDSARRQSNTEHTERQRKLRDLKARLKLAWSSEDVETMDLSGLVSDECARLLASPLYGM